jgi:hypothetical protein
LVDSGVEGGVNLGASVGFRDGTGESLDELSLALGVSVGDWARTNPATAMEEAMTGSRKRMNASPNIRVSQTKPWVEIVKMKEELMKGPVRMRNFPPAVASSATHASLVL